MSFLQYFIINWVIFYAVAIDQSTNETYTDHRVKVAYMRPILNHDRSDIHIQSKSTEDVRRRVRSRSQRRQGKIETSNLENLVSLDHINVQFFSDDPAYDVKRVRSREDRYKSNQLYSHDTFYGETIEEAGVIGSLTLVTNSDGGNGQGDVFGTFTVGETVYSIKTTAEGTFVTTNDPQQFSPEETFDRIVQQDSTLNKVVVADNPNLPNTLYLNNGDLAIDIMILYTRNAMCAINNYSTCQWTYQNEKRVFTFINLLLYQTNIALDMSGISVALRLVKVQYTGDMYDDSSESMHDQLYGIADGLPGWEYMETLRKQYGADMISMITGSGESCGMGFVGPGLNSMANIIRDDCASEYLSFAHEIGHNFGCDHDRANATPNPQNLFAYGWRDTQQEFRTILAYDCDKNFCPRVLRYSNTKTYYGNSYKRPLGNYNHDNARQITTVAHEVSQYYDTKVPMGFALNQKRNDESFSFFYSVEPISVEIILPGKYYGSACSGVHPLGVECPELATTLQPVFHDNICRGLKLHLARCDFTVNIISVLEAESKRKLSNQSLRKGQRNLSNVVKAKFVITGSIQSIVKSSPILRNMFQTNVDQKIGQVISDSIKVLNYLRVHGHGTLRHIVGLTMTKIDAAPLPGNKNCNENSERVFMIDSFNAGTCGWLQNMDHNQRLRICRNPASKASIICPVSCGQCSNKSCNDNMSARFRASGRRSKDCAWLARLDDRRSFCTPGQDAIRTCPETCQGKCSGFGGNDGRNRKDRDKRGRIP